MCTNCLSTAEAAATAAAFVVYAARPRVHRALAAMGLAAAPDPVAHDVRTVAFLRGLELDPVAILGADVVAAADAWRPQPARVPTARRLASARPIGSQSLAIPQ